MEDISADEDTMGAEEKAARWQVGDGRVHILTVAHRCFKDVGDELCSRKPSGISKPVRRVDSRPLPMR
jgi:hypothetical protein